MKELREAAEAMERMVAAQGNAGKNLWCVVSFDGGAKVWTFGSGKGFEGTEVNKGTNMDAEERMATYFPNMIAEHGRHPASVQMITRATPCNRLCTGLIRHLAARFPSIAMITIASWEDYRGQSANETATSKALLNEIVIAAGFDVEIKLVEGRDIGWADLLPSA